MNTCACTCMCMPLSRRLSPRCGPPRVRVPSAGGGARWHQPERVTPAASAMSVSSPSDLESSQSGSPCTQGRRATEREDTEPDEEKICAVCGDRATGYHFHVMTCEGCKGFFRRSINKGIHFSCPFTRSCPVTKAKRRQCQACRLQKCLDVGMRKDMIMSEEALRTRRALRRQRRLAREALGQPGGLTAEQQELISILITAHKRNFDSSFSQFVHYRPAVRLCVHSPQPRSPLEPSGLSVSPLAVASPEPDCLAEDVLPDVFSMLPHFADLSTFMIQQVINFAKEIPAFRSLPIDDQISLLKGATLDICQIQFNTVFNEETNAWECGQHCYTIQDGALAGFQQIYLEPLLKFHISLKKLRLHEAEYVLLQAILLFSPNHAGIAQWEFIDQLQEKVALTLKSYIDHQHPMPEGRFLYAKLLLLLTELQTLKVENTRQILHIQDLSSMTPLLSEIIS
ncbi:nuclear receptor subfamily 1 group I member 3 isoform X2 [Struthio camelus]|uniref:nuclear receptor subfamily 1 group I member 3 isoform X2 n=1 Tax=Struthio camelus TaxID=8801 RepID=UPI00360414F6